MKPPDRATTLLAALERRWRVRLRVAAVLGALGVGLPLLVLAWRTLSARAWLVPVVLIGLVLTILCIVRWLRLRTPRPVDVARHLETEIESLESSAELLVADEDALGPVGRLQRRRVVRALESVAEESVALPPTPVRRASGVLALGVVLAGLVGWWPADSKGSDLSRSPLTATSIETVAAPTIASVDVTITPPDYTGLPPRTIDGLESVEWVVEEGAAVEVEVKVESVRSDASHAVRLSRGETDHTLESTDSGFRIDLTAETDETLQLAIVDDAGAIVLRDRFRRLALIRDQPPEVRIESPPLVSEVGEGRLRLAVEAVVDDDYGIGDAALVATLVLGAGEQVEFREQRFDFATRDGDWRRILDLAALGMEPGGELYFFVEAFDNRPGTPQRSRSATHVARWPGPRRQSVDLGEGLPMILPPETFRSQRQIIIDTERLIAERAQLDADTLSARARTIAFDQNALRLRYGTLLGDEFEDGRPVGPDGAAGRGSPDDHDHDHAKAHHDDAPGSPQEDAPHDHGHAAENGGLFGGDDTDRTTRPMDLAGELEGDLVHAHDSEESATFFTTETKATLKSSLANMWEAELHLHLADPEAALPYEYRALRLLKAVQQASRVYVRRVGFDTPPLDPSRRFTGELDDIPTRRPREEAEVIEERPEVRRAYRMLMAPDVAVGADAATRRADLATALDSAARALRADAATSADGLEALESLRTAVEQLRARPETARGDSGTRLDTALHDRVAAALWRNLPAASALPPAVTGRDDALWRRYRQNLGTSGGRE